MICECCGHDTPYSTWITHRESYPVGTHCDYCYAHYSVGADLRASLIKAPPLPTDTPGDTVWSPWIHTRYQPIHEGSYHVQLEALARKPWVPRNWIVVRYDGLLFEGIDLNHVVAWRGSWKTTF